jgi:amino acid transporter
MSAAVTDHSGGLARHSVNPFEVGAQSVANIAPSAVIAFGPAAMALSAGNGAWFSFLIATIITLVIAFCIAIFARQRAGVGSLYSLVHPVLGPSGSFVTGWALWVGVIGIASGSLAGAGFFLARTIEAAGRFVGLDVSALSSPGGQVVLDVLLILVAMRLTVASVRIAARTAATLEIISISLIVITLLLILLKTGIVFDSVQLSLDGSTLDGIAFAIVIGILGFVGFESAAALGEEAKDRYRAIPRAILGSAILAGVIYVFATYMQVAQFQGGAAALAASGSPMDDLVEQHGLGALRGFLDLGFFSSFFAVVVACINVAARLLFGMAKEGLMPAFLGRAHPTHRTPMNAIYVVLPIVVVPAVILVANGTAPLAVTTWIDTVGVFGYMLAYAMVCLGAPLFLRKLGMKGVALASFMGAVGIIALAYVFYRNVIPVPPFPLNVLPYAFVVSFVVGIVGYAVIRFRDPATAAQAGTYADDMVAGAAADTAIAAAAAD